MAYNGGTLPFEGASKIAHMELIRDPALTQLLQSFQSHASSRTPAGVLKTGSVVLGADTSIRTVVTVDGGMMVVPNPVRREKAVTFIQIGTMIIGLDDIKKIAGDPMMDPRDLKILLQKVDRNAVVVPLSGVRLANQSVKQTNRTVLNAIMSPAWTGLYDVFEYLLSRDWLPPSVPRPKRSMDCNDCGREFTLPRGRGFQCPHCAHDHFLSDYLGLFSETPEEWGKEQLASMVMGAIETLALFKLPVALAKKKQIHRLNEFLLVKDGPLMFRAQGYRLVASIRDFIRWVHKKGASFNLVGVEKTGDFVTYLTEYPELLPIPGDYFIPSMKFLKEEIQGTLFDPTTFRNRVSYGSRIGVRLSQHHCVALQLPTHQMSDQGPISPKAEDMLGLETIVRALAGLTSSAHDNALLPLVLGNRAVSLSESPSSRILDDYINGLIGLAA